MNGCESKRETKIVCVCVHVSSVCMHAHNQLCVVGKMNNRASEVTVENLEHGDN